MSRTKMEVFELENPDDRYCVCSIGSAWIVFDTVDQLPVGHAMSNRLEADHEARTRNRTLTSPYRKAIELLADTPAISMEYSGPDAILQYAARFFAADVGTSRQRDALRNLLKVTAMCYSRNNAG